MLCALPHSLVLQVGGDQTKDHRQNAAPRSIFIAALQRVIRHRTTSLTAFSV